jgi:hypothetical protein
VSALSKRIFIMCLRPEVLERCDVVLTSRLIQLLKSLQVRVGRAVNISVQTVLLICRHSKVVKRKVLAAGYIHDIKCVIS